ncbi:MAG TPA: PAS domain S-box protein, partial [Dissulfurispiraceae bacterium]
MNVDDNWHESFDVITDIVSLHDENFRIIRINKAFSDTFHLKQEEVVGKACYEVVHKTKTPFHSCPCMSAMASGTTITREIYEPRLELYLEITAYPIFNPEGKYRGVLHFAKDITGRKRSEEAEQTKAYLLEISSDAILMLDSEANFLYFNSALMRMTGYTREELMARKLHGIEPPEFAERIRPNIAMLLERGEAIFESAYLRKDSRILPIEVHAIVTRISGRQVIISSVRDISERKRLEEQLLQSQKMEAVGQLAGGIAHDFNNILSAIIGYSELILMQDDKKLPYKEEIRLINESGIRAAELTKQLLAYSRKQVLEVRPINLNNLVDNMAKLLRRVIGENVILEFHTGKAVRNCMADPGQIEQVLMNLVVNARDA